MYSKVDCLVKRLHRVTRRHRGVFLKWVTTILVILVFLYTFGLTGKYDRPLDNDYDSMYSDSFAVPGPRDTTLYQDNSDSPHKIEDYIPFPTHIQTILDSDLANSTGETDIGHIKDVTNATQVQEQHSHGCVDWFEDTMAGNLQHIANYPRGNANWRHIGEDYTSPTTHVSGFPVIVTASDYYHNIQIDELYASLKRYAIPKYNVTKIVVYDIGMYPHHPKRILRNCRICEVRKFPFDKFPAHINPDILKNYAWKPIIIRQLLSEYNWVWWMDASIQLTSSDLDQALQYSIDNSFTFFTSGPSLSVAKHTHPKTFQFLHEDSCKFNNLGEPTAGFVLYHYDSVTRTVVDAWAACALNEQCISPDDSLTKLNCSAVDDVIGTESRGVCHRFDQSVLGILLRRLFHDQNYYPDVVSTISIYKINRLPYYYLSDEDLLYYYSKKRPSLNSINKH